MQEKRSIFKEGRSKGYIADREAEICEAVRVKHSPQCGVCDCKEGRRISGKDTEGIS